MLPISTSKNRRNENKRPLFQVKNDGEECKAQPLEIHRTKFLKSEFPWLDETCAITSLDRDKSCEKIVINYDAPRRRIMETLDALKKSNMKYKMEQDKMLRAKLLEKFSWFKEDPSDSLHGYCNLCLRKVTFKKKNFESHENSKKHKEALMSTKHDKLHDCVDDVKELPNLHEKMIRVRLKEKFSWLEEDSSDYSRGLCNICQHRLLFKKQNLVNHEKSKKHKKAVRSTRLKKLHDSRSLKSKEPPLPPVQITPSAECTSDPNDAVKTLWMRSKQMGSTISGPPKSNNDNQNEYLSNESMCNDQVLELTAETNTKIITDVDFPRIKPMVIISEPSKSIKDNQNEYLYVRHKNDAQVHTPTAIITDVNFRRSTPMEIIISESSNSNDDNTDEYAYCDNKSIDQARGLAATSLTAKVTDTDFFRSKPVGTILYDLLMSNNGNKNKYLNREIESNDEIFKLRDPPSLATATDVNFERSKSVGTSLSDLQKSNNDNQNEYMNREIESNHEIFGLRDPPSLATATDVDFKRSKSVETILSDLQKSNNDNQNEYMNRKFESNHEIFGLRDPASLATATDVEFKRSKPVGTISSDLQKSNNDNQNEYLNREIESNDEIFGLRDPPSLATVTDVDFERNKSMETFTSEPSESNMANQNEHYYDDNYSNAQVLGSSAPPTIASVNDGKFDRSKHMETLISEDDVKSNIRYWEQLTPRTTGVSYMDFPGGEVSKLVSDVCSRFSLDLKRLLKRNQQLRNYVIQNKEISKGKSGIVRLKKILVGHLAQLYLSESTIELWKYGSSQTQEQTAQKAKLEEIQLILERSIQELRELKAQIRQKEMIDSQVL